MSKRKSKIGPGVPAEPHTDTDDDDLAFVRIRHARCGRYLVCRAYYDVCSYTNDTATGLRLQWVRAMADGSIMTRASAARVAAAYIALADDRNIEVEPVEEDGQ